MNIRSLYTYSWFANLAYVKWSEAAWKTVWNKDQATLDAHDAARVPGNPVNPDNDTLGEKIFVQDQWKIANYTPDDATGFSATFFTKGTSNEKVLAIKGTLADSVA